MDEDAVFILANRLFPWIIKDEKEREIERERVSNLVLLDIYVYRGRVLGKLVRDKSNGSQNVESLINREEMIGILMGLSEEERSDIDKYVPSVKIMARHHGFCLDRYVKR